VWRNHGGTGGKAGGGGMGGGMGGKRCSSRCIQMPGWRLGLRHAWIHPGTGVHLLCDTIMVALGDGGGGHAGWVGG
jgi:hypothetical protein